MAMHSLLLSAEGAQEGEGEIDRHRYLLVHKVLVVRRSYQISHFGPRGWCLLFDGEYAMPSSTAAGGGKTCEMMTDYSAGQARCK